MSSKGPWEVITRIPVRSVVSVRQELTVQELLVASVTCLGTLVPNLL